ncbi:MAG: glycosyltransferase family 4 protein [Deltaproteobacteria bacterium]|nr:glycosyltransferase family 4 protein [Deltaproteobacteria bacterium]
MRILIVYQHYLGADQAGGSRFNSFAQHFVAAGHSVDVIAGDLGYQDGHRAERFRHRLLTREQDRQVTVWRCRVPRSYNSGYWGRSLAFAGFTLSALAGVIAARRPQLVIASSPPLTTAFVGAAAARLARCPWIFEVRDLWPESAVTTGVLREGAALTRWLYRVERWACRSASGIVALTPAFIEDMRCRGLLEGDRPAVVVPTGAEHELFCPGPADEALRERLGWGKRFVALYAGAHGRANALVQLIDAAEHLRHRSDILIATFGDGPERQALIADAAKRSLSNITFHGARSRREMPSIIRSADLGLAVLQDNPTFRTVYPNKVFDYMSCQRPVLLAIDGAIRRLVCEQAEAGAFVRPEAPAQLAAAIESLADEPQRRDQLAINGRRWVCDHGTRTRQASRYLDFIANFSADLNGRDRKVRG